MVTNAEYAENTTDLPDRKIRRAAQRNGSVTRLLHEHAGPLEPVVQGLKSRLLQ